MIKVTVTTQALKIKAEKIMASEVMHNPNLNGADYSVELGDFDEIEPNDINGALLFRKIFGNDE